MQAMYGSDWIMRLYYDASSTADSLSYICQIACHKSNLELCDINTLPDFHLADVENIGQVSKVYPLMWRHFPILDPDVDVLLVRDLDSHIMRREVDAVNQFLTSSNV